MITVASWGIYDGGGRRIVRLPYNMRAEADELLGRINANCPKAPHYIALTKEDIDKLPNAIAAVLVSPRRVSGTGTDRVTGEQRRWSKVFHDVEVSSVVEGRYVLVERFVTHRYRGRLRVSGPCGRLDVEQFEAWARDHWQVGWEQVMLRLEG